jgi:hypothetical protein
MLEALLEPLPSDGSNDSEATDKLDEEDRLTIEKCMQIGLHYVLTDSYPKHQETA